MQYSKILHLRAAAPAALSCDATRQISVELKLNYIQYGCAHHGVIGSASTVSGQYKYKVYQCN